MTFDLEAQHLAIRTYQLGLQHHSLKVCAFVPGPIMITVAPLMERSSSSASALHSSWGTNLFASWCHLVRGANLAVGYICDNIHAVRSQAVSQLPASVHDSPAGCSRRLTLRGPWRNSQTFMAGWTDCCWCAYIAAGGGAGCCHCWHRSRDAENLAAPGERKTANWKRSENGTHAMTGRQ